MRRVVGAALLVALGYAALLVWAAGKAGWPLEAATPEPAPRATPAPEEVAPQAATLPSPVPESTPERLERPAAALRAPVAPAPPTTAAGPEAPLVSLDQLLRVSRPAPRGPQSVERPAPGASQAEDPRSSRLRLDYSRERLLEDVPTQPKRHRTDVGVSVRVDEADTLRVRGGVRVDEQEVGERERETKATPTVGVEVRF